ncbi:hypothetical protein GP486_008727 [Trichoglossum hirsutum]|uniref:MARVEL domain-containing protein n=1 Tax=Trichoglossum hirsutum TaxID=265104 RepID=A0A9P8HWS5_9PEZI|nr:hypothetical protein GP486_008727 [Trichoglossum hirsutum]
MFVTVFFVFWRLVQIITLIPTLGMLAYLVHGYILNDSITPDYVLVLFISSVLATFWAIYTLFAREHTHHSAYFIAFIDLCFLGTFIASAWELRDFANADCSRPAATDVWFVSLGPLGQLGVYAHNPWANVQKNCAMLKACFAFAIMNTFFWLFTAWFLLFMHKGSPEDTVTVERRHSHRGHGHDRDRDRGHRRHRSRSHRQPFV